ncbi:alpha-glucuronidase [Emericellopsis cladophorae]|uniref:Alpha-glucuronidase n=1 Tax=Emericellopsis cladophorae TaxID=2686198 RepID=A0A9P9XZE2_9HYPO|nr:alpha-glucuronidase [Emericellopsis cladophorae]KAI6780505.1 alpha-glucuronidase [Emericellopsis cladophorae]
MRPLLWIASALAVARAEDGLDGWLRYARLRDCHTGGQLDDFATSIVALNATEGAPLHTAAHELQVGIQGILGLELDVSDSVTDKDTSSIIVATAQAYEDEFGSLPEAVDLIEDGFYLSNKGDDTVIIGSNERGALYGAFEYLSMLAQGNFDEVAYSTNPDAPIRWANQWDNLWDNGTHGPVERGYGGVSIFYDGVGHVREDLSRVPMLGRLLASIRVNGIVINNVNADPTILSERNWDGVEEIANLFRPWGVRIGMSLNFASPQTFGGLDSFDPLDDQVIDWWQGISDEMYERVPDFAGYLVKANSEGQPGPLTYNRTLADGANMFAKTIAPHGGIVMFRAFVYNHLADWTDWHADRANAAVEFFAELDGQFDDNVVVQIKYGPIDFQVREPVSPLFSTLRETAMAIELQVTQEYLGQQCHLVYLPPLWQTILDFDLRVDGQESRTRDVLNGNVFGKKLGGYTAVTNVGMDPTWLGSHLSMSNLYAFGRLAWDPTLDSGAILDDWTRLTFGLGRSVRETIRAMSLESWPAYENYTGNLGIQTLTDILYTHYGPNPASQDNNGWGQWTRADGDSIGMDRTVRNGTGNAGQYQPEVAARYEETETTPDDLMLWFHHVPYTFELHSGKTVIQHFYDAHYAGAETAATFPKRWETLRGRVDDERFEHELYRLTYQAGHSLVWRDAINEFYRNLSGIPDVHDRVRHHPWRIEAEDMTLDGYVPVDVEPAETASQYRAVVTNGTGTAATTLDFPDGTYNLAVNYYDVVGGNATYSVALDGKTVGTWQGDAEFRLGKFPSEFLDGHSAIRVTFEGVPIRRGDELVVTGVADGSEQAPLDYVSVLPLGVVD